MSTLKTRAPPRYKFPEQLPHCCNFISDSAYANCSIALFLYFLSNEDLAHKLLQEEVALELHCVVL